MSIKRWEELTEIEHIDREAGLIRPFFLGEKLVPAERLVAGWHAPDSLPTHVVRCEMRPALWWQTDPYLLGNP